MANAIRQFGTGNTIMSTHLIEYDAGTLEVWCAIVQLIDDRVLPPTMSEIGAACGEMPNSKVQYHLQKLVRAGCIVREPYAHRGLKVVRRPDSAHLELQPLDNFSKTECGSPNCLRLRLMSSAFTRPFTTIFSEKKTCRREHS